MADFRKWLLALAAVAVLLCLGSSTASAATTFTCQTNAGNPTIIRAEGVAELVGDLTLNCTGGTPTAAGKNIPPSNVQVTLNTNITSRLINSSNVSEAVILIDEPFPANPNPTVAEGGTTNNQGSANNQLGCLAVNSVNCAMVSLGSGIGATGSYRGTVDFNGPHYNVFQGVQSGNAIVWQGVPIDAPGSAGTRVIRITNIRANAALLGVSSSFIPTQITELIGVNGSQGILINNPSQTVAEVVPGLIVSNGTSTYTQCVDVNDTLIGGTLSGSPVPIGGASGPFSISAAEGFGASFKVRTYNQIIAGLGLGGGTPNTADPSTDIGLQNIPGFIYDTESGFVPGSIGAASPGGNYVSGAGAVGQVGLATQGTQISFTFAGVQSGVSVFVPGAITLTGNYGGATPGYAVLVGGDGATDLNQVTVTGTTATATYEITYEDPSVTETLTVPVDIAYISNTGQNLPAAGTATVAVNFSPLSTSAVASLSAPIPRFQQPHAAGNLFTIVSCTCNLLFPFVTNQAGFDTGVAIANTTADTLNGVVPQTGPVTLTYYGTTTGGGAAPATQTTTDSIASGAELVFTLSGGGTDGITATPGFQGYIIARADFQYCHGFAFISDAGAQKLAEGYLAIQLDVPGLERTGVPGENQGH